MSDSSPLPRQGYTTPTAMRPAYDAPEAASYQSTNYSDAPEVAHDPLRTPTYAAWPQQYYDPCDKSVCLTSTKEAVEASLPVSDDKPKSRRTKLIIIFAVLAIAVVAVVATTVGILTSRKGNAPLASTPPASTPPVSAPTTNQFNNSRLAVTGYRSSSGGGFRYRLYYQTQAGTIRFSEYAGDSGQWQGPYNISGTNTALGAGMAASIVMTTDPPQWEYFWRDSNNNLKGRNWIKPMPQQTNGLEDSINNFPVSTSPMSSVAAYWPYIATQDTSATTDGSSRNTLRVTTYLGGELGGAPWVNATMSAVATPGVAAASEGSALAIVPRAATYKRPWEAGLVYRAADGRLAGVSLSWGRNTTWEPWSIAGIPIPQNSRIAAFAVASSTSSSTATEGSSSSTVSTGILYQQSGGAIYYVTYSGRQWSQSVTHAVFADAIADTDIACLTESLWTANADAVLTLSGETDMSRCFFFVSKGGGGIKEVLFDGTSWSEVGLVPI
ncbi:hypothetical protein MN608_06684 [Microdochium nivale]|nr:hypothetical protein MN608_06684 [Microdochium nivale]